MKLENDFEVPVDVETAWRALLDVERVARCVPGARLDDIDGDLVRGQVAVKLGPLSMTYAGTAQFVTRDEANRTVVLATAAKDRRGNGGARAEMTMQLTAGTAASTRCSIVTDLDLTGQPAQFGRGVVQAVGTRLVDQFAQRLAADLDGSTSAEVRSEAQPVPTNGPSWLSLPSARPWWFTVAASVAGAVAVVWFAKRFAGRTRDSDRGSAPLPPAP